MLRLVKVTIHAAIFLQVLPCATSVTGREVSPTTQDIERVQGRVYPETEFVATTNDEERGVSPSSEKENHEEETEDEKEERMSESDFVFTTPIPGAPPPPTYEHMMKVMGPSLAKFNKTMPEKSAPVAEMDSDKSESEKDDTPSPPKEKETKSKKTEKDDEEVSEVVEKKSKADSEDDTESVEKKKRSDDKETKEEDQKDDTSTDKTTDEDEGEEQSEVVKKKRKADSDDETESVEKNKRNDDKETKEEDEKDDTSTDKTTDEDEGEEQSEVVKKKRKADSDDETESVEKNKRSDDEETKEEDEKDDTSTDKATNEDEEREEENDEDEPVTKKKKRTEVDDEKDAGDKELNDLLSSLSGGDKDSSLGGMFEGGNGSLDVDALMKQFGSMFGDDMGGLNLFGDPSLPQNKTVEFDDIRLSELYGGIEDGDAFSDVKNVKFGQMLLNITVRGAARVDSIGLSVMTQDTYVDLVHGGKGGGKAFLEPEMGETIKKVEVHWGEHKGKICIFYIKMTISSGKYIAAGKKTSNVATLKPPKGYQIGGFYGRADHKGIYCLGAVYTRSGVQDLWVTDVMALTDKRTPDIYQYKTTIRNWVGPLTAAPDTACYKKNAGLSKQRKCPSGYHRNGNDCAAQCPLMFPVECFSMCLPQNGDCAMEIVGKVSAAAGVALNFATAGIFGVLFKVFKGAKHALACAINIVNAVKSIIFYTRYVQVTIPQTHIEKLMDKAFQLQVAILDIPLAVCACLGIQVPPLLQFSAFALAIGSALIMMGVMVHEAIFGSKENVLLMLREAGAMNTTELNSEEIDLQTILNTKNGTCGYEMRTLTNRVLGKVYQARNNHTEAETNDLRVKVSKSQIVQVDIPTVTNHCMGDLMKNKTSAAAFKTREVLRKTLGVIVDQIVEDGTTDMGKNVVKQDKALEFANMGLFILSMFDPTGIAWMASEFVQPVCGPTDYLGEIDDGTLYDALALTTVDQAFLGSYGIWKKVGDGTVTIHFHSVDIYDVNVVIHSAGDKIAEVRVPAGKTATWASTVKELQDKTLYLDRWRPGLFGLSGSGGGSLLMWVPRSSEGGKLILHARVNVS